MKTDDDSEEAEEPPGNNSRKQKNYVSDANEKNDELEWARKHMPKSAVQSQEPTPATASPGPAASAAFRKTELWDRPPLFRSEEPVIRQKTLAVVLGPDTDIPYVPFEDSLRSLIGQVVRRQETIARRLAEQMDDLHDRIDDLEDKIELVIAHLEHRIAKIEREKEKECDS